MSTSIKPIIKNPEDFPLSEVFDYNKGLFTEAAGTTIPEEALLQNDNCEYLRGMLFRRNGISSWPVTKPDSNPVLAVFGFFEVSTGLNLMRFTPTTIYKFNNTNWINFPPSGIAANSGGALNPFSIAQIQNRCFYANGVDPIREIDAVNHVYKALGDAPVYKYITTAFNRIIGVNLVAVSAIPNQVGWSGDTNYGEFNPAVDISAGFQNLQSSPSTIADDCSGIFSTAELLIVTRLGSIWIGIHTPSSTAPFSFFAALPHIGADLPRTIKLTDYGLIWVSNQTSSVYAWQPSVAAAYGATEPRTEDIEISAPIHRQLRVDLNNAADVWASFSHETKIYSLYISYNTTSTVKAYHYNFHSKSWSTSSVVNSPTSTNDLDFANSQLTINQLSGTIAALTGTINSLGGLQQNTTRIIGYSNGDLGALVPYTGFPAEVNNITITDLGVNYQTTVDTKDFEFPPADLDIKIIRFYLYPFSTGTVTLWYSKDDGNTWTSLKSVTFTNLARQKYIQLRRFRKSRRFRFRLTTSDCMCAFAGHIIKAAVGGISNK